MAADPAAMVEGVTVNSYLAFGAAYADELDRRLIGLSPTGAG